MSRKVVFTPAASARAGKGLDTIREPDCQTTVKLSREIPVMDGARGFADFTALGLSKAQVIGGKIAAQKGNQVGTAWLYGVGLVLAITSLIFTWLGWLAST